MMVASTQALLPIGVNPALQRPHSPVRVHVRVRTRHLAAGSRSARSWWSTSAGGRSRSAPRPRRPGTRQLQITTTPADPGTLGAPGTESAVDGAETAVVGTTKVAAASTAESRLISGRTILPDR